MFYLDILWTKVKFLQQMLLLVEVTNLKTVGIFVEIYDKWKLINLYSRIIIMSEIEE